MSKEQIEEMAECLIDIQQNFNEYCAKPCRECELGGIVNCENHYKAEALYTAGYRKQSEGEWVKTETNYTCSKCDFNVISWSGEYEGYECERGISLMHYCPNCGAKMKVGAK